MKRVLTAVVLVPLVLLAVFKSPLWLFALIVTLIAILTLHEYLNIVRSSGIEPVDWVTYGFSVLLIAGLYLAGSAARSWYSPNLHWAILLLAPLLSGVAVVFRREMHMALAATASSVFGVLYIALPLGLLVTMRWMPGQGILIVLVLFSVWAGDVAAYYAGRSLGRHKLAPVVSPNKTWEGAIASIVASIGAAMLVFLFYQQIDRLLPNASAYWLFPSPSYFSPGPRPAASFYVIILGAVTNIAAQFGDLFESALKRSAKVKDSGSLLPGHGGILDRIDALLFAVPVVWYYANFQPFWSLHTL
jgi:phosphatidate cytidylyltransferase